jgi:8-oxo-dGTP diphosphatase
MSHKNYVVGFLFNGAIFQDGRYSQGATSVALIKKNRGPADMAGKLNGIGGKIEPGETPLVAMKREFFEETNAYIQGWTKFCELSGNDWTVHFFRVFPEYFIDIKTTTDEVVGYYNVKDILEDRPYRKIMPNLSWLIPMALDEDITDAKIFDSTHQ